jgi:predicted MFS family arabinose efflux permease
VQWLTIQGTFFVTSVFLQQVRGYSAIDTGLMLTPATAGILLSAAGAERFARRRSQRRLVIVGFVLTVTGMVLQLALVREDSGVLSSVPGLFLIGVGVGAMLTSSVNIVQSSFPDHDQGDISGLSRSVSNLGSSLGTALAGSIITSAAFPGGRPYAAALVTMTVITLIGLILAVLIPRRPQRVDAR